MTVINYIKDFYVHHTCGEILLMLYFIWSFVLTVWACIGEDDNALFFPILLVVAGVLVPLIWFGDLMHKIQKKKFYEKSRNEYQFIENPYWVYDLRYKGMGEYKRDLQLCQEKETGLFVIINFSSCRISEKFTTIEEMEKKQNSYTFYSL